MRTILRNNNDQKKLENNGFVKIEFFTPNILEKFKKVIESLPDSWANIESQNSLNNLLQSKLEYRFINFYPIYYEKIVFNTVSSSFVANDPICNENIEKSISILIPLSINEKYSVFFLKKGHLINNFPRLDFKLDFSSVNKQYIVEKKMNRFEAYIHLNNLPYSLNKNEVYLKISMMPYGSKIFIFEKKDLNFIGFRILEDRFVNFKIRKYEDVKKYKRFFVFEQEKINLSLFTKSSFFGSVVQFIKQVIK